MARILIVKASVAVTGFWRTVLESEGHYVDSSSSADEALEDILPRHVLFDLVIIGEKLSGKTTGSEFASILKAKYLSLPVLMIAGSKPPDGCVANLILQEPMPVSSFIEAVESLLEK